MVKTVKDTTQEKTHTWKG